MVTGRLSLLAVTLRLTAMCFADGTIASNKEKAADDVLAISAALCTLQLYFYGSPKEK